MELRNYVSLTKRPIFFRRFAYVDSSDYLAFSLFLKYDIHIRFGRSLIHPEKNYKLVFCRVWKKDADRFLKALSELPNKMLLCGRLDYEDFCRKTIVPSDRVKNVPHRKYQGVDIVSRDAVIVQI